MIPSLMWTQWPSEPRGASWNPAPKASFGQEEGSHFPVSWIRRSPFSMFAARASTQVSIFSVRTTVSTHRAAMRPSVEKSASGPTGVVDPEVTLLHVRRESVDPGVDLLGQDDCLHAPGGDAPQRREERLRADTQRLERRAHQLLDPLVAGAVGHQHPRQRSDLHRLAAVTGRLQPAVLGGRLQPFVGRLGPGVLGPGLPLAGMERLRAVLVPAVLHRLGDLRWIEGLALAQVLVADDARGEEERRLVVVGIRVIAVEN